MQLYFIRHGETDFNKNGQLQGQTDIPLNKEGESQALAARKKIGNMKNCAVFLGKMTFKINKETSF